MVPVTAVEFFCPMWEIDGPGGTTVHKEINCERRVMSYEDA